MDLTWVTLKKFAVCSKVCSDFILPQSQSAFYPQSAVCILHWPVEFYSTRQITYFHHFKIIQCLEFHAITYNFNKKYFISLWRNGPNLKSTIVSICECKCPWMNLQLFCKHNGLIIELSHIGLAECFDWIVAVSWERKKKALLLSWCLSERNV